ncbi:MAG: hypothetical protein PVJ39_20740 [Gammaproteobacteria bacterium]
MDENADTVEYGLGFWIDQARELKKAADACWALDRTVLDRAVEGEYEGLAKSVLQQAMDVNTDLKWLYGNLTAFAIQYLSIGILIDKNKKRFLHEVPGNRIVELAEECGIALNPVQKTFLTHIENAFKWNEKHPQWNVTLNREELVSLKVKQVADKVIKHEEKQELDELYNRLRTLALGQLPDYGGRDLRI